MIPLLLVLLSSQPSRGLPVILEGPQSVEVQVGGSVFFKCRSSLGAEGIVWTHDGAQVFSDRQSGPLSQSQFGVNQILEDGTLVIQKVVHSSEGIYACTATDQDGIVASRPAILTVSDKRQKPRITHRAIRTSVNVGDLIVLDCLASGYPPPLYIWYKNGGRLSPAHDRFSLAENGSLIIQNAQLDDSAHYRCSASNYLGKATSSARVKVDSSAPPSPPRITTRPRNKSVQEGAIIELTCVAEGSPYPTVTWWNNRRLVTVNSRVTLSNGGQHLRIQDIEVYDQGDYTCVAENSLGTEQIVSLITVVPDPTKQQGNRRISSPLRPLLSGGGQSSSRPRQQISSGPIQGQTIRATRGSTVQLRCTLQGIRGGLLWEKNGEALTHSSHRLASDGSIFLYNLETSDSGEYTCYKNAREKQLVAHVVVIAEPQDPRIVVPSRISPNQVQPDNVDERRQFFRNRTRKPSNRPIRPLSAPNRPNGPNRTNNNQRSTSFNQVGLNFGQGSIAHQNFGRGGNSNPHQEPAHQDSGRGSTSNPHQESVLTETILAHPVGSEVETEEEIRHETDLSYDVSGPGAGDRFVLISLEEAKKTVDRALEHTVDLLFTYQQHTERTPHQLLNIFRYPSGNDRELARAAEIYHRTLDLVEEKVKEGEGYNLTTFSIHNLISPANLELIGNLSGCEAHRRNIDCQDVCFHNKYRSADGTCNNWSNPLLGASLTPLRRILKPLYENGFNTPIGYDPEKLYNGFKKPGARQVSSTIISSKKVTEDPLLTGMMMQWGQFVDHDLGHSMESVSRETFGTGVTCGGSCDNEPPCFPIPVPIDDKRIHNHRCMEFTRSSASCGSGTTSVFFEKLQTREQVNQLTSFIDASQVYGSERTLAVNLRNLTNDFGRLREGITYDHGKPLLPFNDGHPIDCRRDPRESDIGCFLAGDVRANEQLGLLALHTIWFREHNRIAEQLRELNPHWEGDRLYEESRKIVGASMQHITYKHWLPKVLGEPGMKKIGEYKGYDAGLDPSISNVFTTAAFRFGHSLIHPTLHRLNSNYTSIAEGNLSLHAAFFSPWRIVEEGGVDPVLRGLYYFPSKMPMAGQPMNTDLTEKLFQVAHTVALDLGALNIQRGRDHGLPPYTQWVEHCGLGRIESWESLSLHIKDVAVLAKLKKLYGDPRNIDLWVGAILEGLVEGGRLGPTFQCIVTEQFSRLRDADRFWYEREGVFTPDQKAELMQATLHAVICQNGDDIRRVPRDMFLKTSLGEFIDCARVRKLSLLPWKECERDFEDPGLISRRSRRESYPDSPNPGQET